MLFKEQELKHLWPFYLYKLIYGISTMIFPFLVIYFINQGYSYFQVSVITAAQGAAMFLFEIPTGSFADRFSRKYSLSLGFVIVGCASFLIPFTGEFYLHATLWAITGIGMTFASGSEEALVIDNLNKLDRKDLHHEYFIKSNSFVKLGSIFAPILGAVLVQSFSIDVLWYVFAIGHGISALVIWLFCNESINTVKLPAMELIRKSYQTSKMGIAYAFRHKVIRNFIIAGLFINLMMVSNLGLQPLLVDLGMAEYQLGYLYSITALVNIGMSFLSRKFINRDPRNLMTVVVLIVMALLLCLLFVYPPFFYIACFIFIMRDGMFNFGIPVLFTYVHGYIPEKIRATVISAKSMLDQLVIALAYVGAGSLMDVFGTKHVLAFTSLFGIIVIFFYRKMQEKTN